MEVALMADTLQQRDLVFDHELGFNAAYMPQVDDIAELGKLLGGLIEPATATAAAPPPTATAAAPPPTAVPGLSPLENRIYRDIVGLRNPPAITCEEAVSAQRADTWRLSGWDIRPASPDAFDVAPTSGQRIKGSSGATHIHVWPCHTASQSMMWVGLRNADSRPVYSDELGFFELGKPVVYDVVGLDIRVSQLIEAVPSTSVGRCPTGSVAAAETKPSRRSGTAASRNFKRRENRRARAQAKVAPASECSASVVHSISSRVSRPA
jgi:hypothetical protein